MSVLSRHEWLVFDINLESCTGEGFSLDSVIKVTVTSTISKLLTGFRFSSEGVVSHSDELFDHAAKIKLMQRNFYNVGGIRCLSAVVFLHSNHNVLCSLWPKLFTNYEVELSKCICKFLCQSGSKALWMRCGLCGLLAAVSCFFWLLTWSTQSCGVWPSDTATVFNMYNQEACPLVKF